MNLTEAQLTSIIYEKDTGDTSARVIIPTHVPKTVIKAIDLSEATPEDRAVISGRYLEYKEYVAAQMANLMTFESWVDNTYNEEYKLKWRSFKVSGLR